MRLVHTVGYCQLRSLGAGRFKLHWPVVRWAPDRDTCSLESPCPSGRRLLLGAGCRCEGIGCPRTTNDSQGTRDDPVEWPRIELHL